MSTGLINFFLVLHILGAATWLGCNVAQAFLGGMVGSAPTEVRAWWAEGGEKLGKVVYTVAGVTILASGIIMLLGSGENGMSFGSTFVSIGFAAIIVGIALGITVFGPKNRALAAAIRSGDEAEEKKLRTTIMQFGMLDTLIVVITVFAMVYKWGIRYKG